MKQNRRSKAREEKMGYGRWSDDDYRRRESDRKTTGRSAFTYTDHDMRNVERSNWRVHPKMNPQNVTRESRDSATHPESLAIISIFDHTGSMGDVPRVFQKNLTRLMGALLQRGINDPQILIGAVGDATCDRTPLQIGQFESGIEIDNDLGKLLLEGGGGGHVTESYELAIYFAARHTSIDCWEKRKRKGYLFVSGDEEPYPQVKAHEVKNIIGDDLKQNISVAEIIAEAKEKYHIFMIRPTFTSWGNDENVHQRWVSLLGQDHVIKLDCPELISEVTALVIGLTEGKFTLKEGLENLKNLEGIKLGPEMLESLFRSLSSVSATPKQPAKTKAKTPDASEPSKKKKPGRI